MIPTKITDREGNIRYYLGEGYCLHREDGPAVILNNGSKFWYLNNKRHRLDGPANEWFNGNKSWWINGKRHRIDGPAFTYAGIEEWWYNDKRIDCKTQEEFERLIRIKAFW
jgi:hypothetical protein